MLADISNVVQIVGLPLALIAILLAYREGRHSRDLQAALTFSESFRASWEMSWRKTLQELEERTAKGEELPPELSQEVQNMLNWFDWVGWLIHSDVLARPNHVLGSIAPVLRRVLEATQPIIAAGEEANGPQWWHGVRILENSLNNMRPNGGRRYSFLATSGPVMRVSSGKVAAMMPSDATIPPATRR